MGRLTGVLGILAILLFAYLFSTNRKAIRLKTVIIGLMMQFVFAVLVLRVAWGERVIAVAGDAVTRLLELFVRRIGICFWPAGQQSLEVRLLFCVPGVADHHLHCGILRHSLSLRRDAVHHSPTGQSHGALHGRQRRGVDGRRGQHLYGTDRSSPDHPSIPGDRDPVGTDGDHDCGNGAHFRRSDGSVYRLWHRSAASVGGGDHDRAGDDPDCQDAGARDREATDGWDHEARRH